MIDNKRRVRRKSQKRKPLTEEIKFHRRLKSMFLSMGMDYVETTHKEIELKNRKVEVDFVLIYKNILIIGEETTAKPKGQNLRDHIRGKKQAFEEITSNFDDFLEWLYELHPDRKEELQEYKPGIKTCFVYCSMHPTQLPECEKSGLYEPIKFMEPSVISYFQQMTKCLKHTEVYEFLHFLGLHQDDVGNARNMTDRSEIRNTIITPETGTNLADGVRTVSFMMAADTLMRAGYVLRKDSWNSAGSCYQRLIKPNRLNKIRAYIAEKESTFINNIIVVLPETATFSDVNGERVDIFSDKNRRNFADLKMSLPIEMNSICIIDGQHRVFAHYEGVDKLENKIKKVRGKRYLLVTGLVFAPGTAKNRSSQIQSQLFLDINQNTQKVPQDVTLQIRRTAEPLSDISIATKVLELMNAEEPFVDKFEFSGLSDGQRRIKTTSIILYALRKVVSTHKSDEDNLFKYWKLRKSSSGNESNITDSTVDDYSQYCEKQLITFFKAVKSRFKDQWDIAEGNHPGPVVPEDNSATSRREDELQKLKRQSKLFSVVSINGFIMCFGKLISETGLCEKAGYEEMLEEISDINFDSTEFSYTSSQYAQFSEKLISDIREGASFKKMKEKKESTDLK